MDTVKSFEREFKVNGRTYVAHVIVQAENELEPPDFAYGTPEEDAAEQARFDSGELVNLIVHVKAECDEFPGCEGMDSMGQVFVKAGDVDSLMEVAGYPMAHNAVEELQRNAEVALATKYLLIVKGPIGDALAEADKRGLTLALPNAKLGLVSRQNDRWNESIVYAENTPGALPALQAWFGESSVDGPFPDGTLTFFGLAGPKRGNK